MKSYKAKHLHMRTQGVCVWSYVTLITVIKILGTHNIS